MADEYAYPEVDFQHDPNMVLSDGVYFDDDLGELFNFLGIITFFLFFEIFNVFWILTYSMYHCHRCGEGSPTWYVSTTLTWT